MPHNNYLSRDTNSLGKPAAKAISIQEMQRVEQEALQLVAGIKPTMQGAHFEVRLLAGDNLPAKCVTVRVQNKTARQVQHALRAVATAVGVSSDDVALINATKSLAYVPLAVASQLQEALQYEGVANNAAAVWQQHCPSQRQR